MWALLSFPTVFLLPPPLVRLRTLLLANVGLQVLDGHLTLRGLALGFSEGNPLVGRLIAMLGPWQGVLLIKILAIGGLFALYRRGRHPLVIRGLATLAVAYTLFAIVPWTLLLAGS